MHGYQEGHSVCSTKAAERRSVLFPIHSVHSDTLSHEVQEPEGHHNYRPVESPALPVCVAKYSMRTLLLQWRGFTDVMQRFSITGDNSCDD